MATGIALDTISLPHIIIWQPGVDIQNRNREREMLPLDLMGAVNNTNSYLNVKQSAINQV